MSQPDFDGVYRTRPADGVFPRKQRDDDRSQKVGSNRSKANPSQPTKRAPLPHSQGTPPVRGGVPLGGGIGSGCQPPLSPAYGVGSNRGMVEKNVENKPRARKTKKPDLVIIEDTREQTPLTDWPDGVKIENHGLDTGDYSIKGWENCFTIERKSLADFAGTMLNGYQGNTQKPRLRFNNELERMRHFDLAAVIVTATPFELMTFKHHCGMDAHEALWNFGLSVYATYRIPVFYLGDEQTAAKWISDLARHFVAMRTKKNRSREDRAKQIADEWAF